MRLVNFNKHTNTFYAWNKQYCYDLNRKITSLYDYMMWNYPEYFIFNTPVSVSGGVNSFKPYESLIDSTKEPRLKTQYEECINLYDTDSQPHKVSLFYPSKLNFHQGFYNNSEGDGLLIEGISEIRCGNTFRGIFSKDVLLMLASNNNYYLVQYDEFDYKSGNIFIDWEPDFVYGFVSTSKTWETISTSNYTVNTSSLYININTTKYSKIAIYRYIDPIYNFLVGYVCVLNKQVIGINSPTNPIKNTLDSYLLIPLGNGGYYDMYWVNDNFLASYKDNKLNDFSNKITINLAKNCRYVNITKSGIRQSNYDVTIPNWGLSNTAQLADRYNNIWVGQEDLVGQTFVGGEKVFADVTYSSYTSVANTQTLYNFNAHTWTKFLFDVDLLLY